MKWKQDDFKQELLLNLYRLKDRIIDNIFIGDDLDAEQLGEYGEKLTVDELKYLQRFGKDGKILRNLYIPKDNGETSEIDVVFITQKGIFVIESKNYSGWIFGNEKDLYWTASLPNGEKNRFYNPVMQNRTHIKWLHQYLVKNVPLYSLIVFSERCRLKKVTIASADVYVMHREELHTTIGDIWSEATDTLNEQDIHEIYETLHVLTNPDSTIKENHTNTVNHKFGRGTGADSDVCPLCGNKLVLRTAKKGINAGHQFYGCSGFPKCRYIKNI